MLNPFSFQTRVNVLGTQYPVNQLTTDLLNGEVVVEHASGIVTVHDHVSRLAILALIYCQSISLDLWVENNLSDKIDTYFDHKRSLNFNEV